MSKSIKNKTYEIQENQLGQDFLISHYKSQILYRTKTAGNYTELQLKFRNLQTEMTKLSNENLKLKFSLAQLKETNERQKNELSKSNQELIKQIKDKDSINRQIYNDNRVLNFELEKKIDVRQMSNFQGRYCGRVSEIIFNVWLNYQIETGRISKDEVKILPYVYMEKVDWLKKVSRFLRAKLFHEKYEV